MDTRKAAIEMRDSYATEHERDAFAAGYDHASGIAAHNTVRVGDIVEEYDFDVPAGEKLETVEDARDYHRFLCFADEEHSRCYSPWEFTAAEINSLDEFDAADAWEAYDAGVAAAIDHDLSKFSDEHYEESE